jgi:DNA-binding CsgD family transcriptional regulator
MTDNLGLESAFFSEQYHRLIGLIYDAVTHDHGFYPFLRQFIKVFDCLSSSFSIYDVRASGLLGFWTDIPEPAVRFYVEHVSHRDALVEAALAVGGRRFVASNLDIENIEQVRIDTRVGEWMASIGAFDAAGVVAYQSDHYVNFFAVQRSVEQGGFSREELAVFDLFLPHLNRAVALYTEMSALRTDYVEVGALEACAGSRGILVCDASCKVVFCSAAAKSLLGSDTGIRLEHDGVLSFSDDSFSRQFAINLSHVMRASVVREESEDILMRYRHGNCRLTWALTPLLAGGGAPHRGGAVISLYDWSRRPVLLEQRARQLFGLTAAEARVIALLAQGYGAADIAAKLVRAHETVRAQLRAIYAKTNTRSQGELVALLAASGAVS